MRTFVYKMRPTGAQVAVLTDTLETCRRLYNHALAERKTAWEERGESIGFAQQCASLPVLKRDSSHLPHVHSQVLQDVLHRLDRAFQAFFRRMKAGEKPGYPRFRGSGWYDSFTYPQWGNGVRQDNGRLILPKIGTIRLHRDRPLEGTPKTCTIVRKADGWYANIACDVAPSPLPPTGKAVGVDVGLESFATLSDGTQIANPRYYRAAERTLKQAQRRLSRREKGSNRRRKARELLAKAHLKIKRARQDFAHKTARVLINEYDQIAVEKLSIRGMVRNHTLAKSIADAGWGIFRSVLIAKTRFVATLQCLRPNSVMGFRKPWSAIPVSKDCKARLAILKPCLRLQVPGVSWWKSTLPERRNCARNVVSQFPNNSLFAGTPARIVAVNCTAIIWNIAPLRSAIVHIIKVM